MNQIIAFFLIASSLSTIRGEQCPIPPTAANFSLERLNGTWFEIGKIQTFGGALIEGDCVCTELVYSKEDDTHASVANICNDKTPDGKLKIANSEITEVDNNPGAFEETFCSSCPPVSYTIVALDGQSMVEYDCSRNAIGIINYCFHVMSRTSTMDEETLVSLQNLVDEYDLNPHNISWKTTNQTGCGWR
mmetsp:Transcript_25384/g.30085  ORF Transcript_25384/g.30085 Transcript_25384/m.30085 type:complete len:190 (-) Transcript_25384:80-649(-)